MVTLERGVVCDWSLGALLFVDCSWRQARLAPVLAEVQEMSYALPFDIGGWGCQDSVDWWVCELRPHVLRSDGCWLALYRLETWSSLIEHALSVPARENRLALP